MLNEQLTQDAGLPISNWDGDADGAMPFAHFVASKFIPNHVELKRPAGRVHYHAILKHIITPDLVDRLFAPYHGEVNGRMKALSGWPYLNNVRIGEITAEHVRRLTDSAKEHGYSHHTVKHIRNVVSAIFSHARRERVFFGDNPVSEVDLPRVPEARQTLSIRQAKSIVDMLDSPEREIALITISTGLRIPEICALQWKHINLGRSRAFVDGVWMQPGFLFVTRYWLGAEIVDAPPTRVKGVAVTSALTHELLKLKQQKLSEPDSYLVSGPDGCALTPSQIRTHRLKTAVRKLGVPWASWHVLRQAFEGQTQQMRFRS